LSGQSQALWDRWFRRTAESQEYWQSVRENAKSQLALRHQLHSVQKTQTASEAELSDAERRCDEAQGAFSLRQKLWLEKVEEREALRRLFPELRWPADVSALEQDDFQIKGLWQDAGLNKLRSELFAAALQLHEAWLAQVCRQNAGFRANIFAVSELLSNKRPQDDAHFLPIWQSLFLMVPVVSSTFASFANQFRGLGPGTLGWVFIDEAGQAVPQAAVGALFRAQRSIIVGDPLQIEPVFAVAIRLIGALSELSPVTAGREYALNNTSVQRLADRANRFGALLIREDGSPDLFVGSPLRVHCRCIDPMFKVSNRIAYQEKMIFGLKSREQDDGPPMRCKSAWIDIKGSVRNNQEVVAQTDFVSELVFRIYQRDRKLPFLYIISPFKAVAKALKSALGPDEWRQKIGNLKPPNKTDLTEWLKQRIGTVHTFQGKEEDTVTMVLGVDNQTLGAAAWASSKPNLLNVALTRAKRRFFIVGDQTVWSPMNYFDEARRELPVRTGAEILGTVN